MFALRALKPGRDEEWSRDVDMFNVLEYPSFYLFYACVYF